MIHGRRIVANGLGQIFALGRFISYRIGNMKTEAGVIQSVPSGKLEEFKPPGSRPTGSAIFLLGLAE